PAVQVGAKLDHEWPPEKVTLSFSASSPFTLRPADGAAVAAGPTAEGRFVAQWTTSPKPNQPLPVEIILACPGGIPDLAVSYHTAEDARPRALPLHRMLVPWAEMSQATGEAVVQRDLPELRGGSWARGRKVFFSEQAACSKCHSIQGQGGEIGPDLSNL